MAALGASIRSSRGGARRRRRRRAPRRARRRPDRVRQDPRRRRHPDSSPPRPPACGGCGEPGAVARPRGARGVRRDAGDTRPPGAGVDRRGPGAAVDRPRARLGARRPARRRRAELRARGPPHDRQPGATQRAVCDVGRVLRDPATAPARPPGGGGRCRRPRSPGSSVVAGRLDRLGGPTEPPARLHGDLWAGNRLVDVDGRNWLDRPGRARRASRVRPRDDAAVRRLRASCFARLRGRASRWPTAGPIASRCTRSRRSSCTRSSSAAATSPPRPPQSPATPDPTPSEPGAASAQSANPSS